MKMLSITFKDLKVFIKDRGAILYLFLLPLIFILLFAAIGKATDTGGDETDIPLPLLNIDSGNSQSEPFIEALKEAKQVNVVEYQEAEAYVLLDEAEIDYLLIIPDNFSRDIEAEIKVYVPLLVHPNSNTLEVDTVERVVNKAGRQLMMLDYLNDSLLHLRRMQAMNPQVDYYLTEERIMNQAESQMEHSEEHPLVTVVETTPAEIRGEKEVAIPDLGQIATVGFAVMFVFLASQNTANSIFDEKRTGTFRRLVAAPVGNRALLGGKLLPNLLLTLVQIMLIFLAGVLLLPLLGVEPLDLTSDPLGLVLASLSIALCSTSLGIFIAGLAKTEGQVSGLSNALLWLAALIGGSFVPSFLLPDLINSIGRFVPQYWANQVFYGLILRGETLTEVWIDIVALLGFTLVFFVIGVWRFDFD